MAKQKRKLTILASTALVLTLLMAGCVNTSEDISVNNQDTQATTEIVGTETEITVNTEEPTEQSTEVVVEEETETEEEVIATGYSIVNEGRPIVMEYPSLEDYGEQIGLLNYGEKVEILEEYYNEKEQRTYYRVRLENGKKGYVATGAIELDYN